MSALLPLVRLSLAQCEFILVNQSVPQNCVPDKTGKRCINCGWVWKLDKPWPRRNCGTVESLPEMIAEFDDLMESGNIDAETHPADAIGRIIMQHGLKRTGKLRAKKR